MDITNINSMYSDIAAAGNRSAQLEKMKADYQKINKGTDEQELMDACKQFEAYFIEQMYKEMWKSVPQTQYSSNASKNSAEYYRESFIKEMASQTAESGEIGLAQILFDNMKISQNALSIEDIRARKAEKESAEAGDATAEGTTPKQVSAAAKV